MSSVSLTVMMVERSHAVQKQRFIIRKLSTSCVGSLALYFQKHLLQNKTKQAKLLKPWVLSLNTRQQRVRDQWGKRSSQRDRLFFLFLARSKTRLRWMFARNMTKWMVVSLVLWMCHDSLFSLPIPPTRLPAQWCIPGLEFHLCLQYFFFFFRLIL